MDNDFDFWLGAWMGTWQDGERSAVNTVTSEYGGRVVVERFVADAPETLQGLSVSVFDARDGCWKQTWVDDNGSYLDFRGGFDGESMVLTRQLLDRGVPVTQRMVWHDIHEDWFHWAWQRSRAGADWETLWAIAYERIP
jgi:hypothetical protein